MIFSKDKRPTKGGNFWAINGRSDKPHIRHVYRQPNFPHLGPGYDGLLIVEGQGDIEHSHLDWGDEIITPEIEPEAK